MHARPIVFTHLHKCAGSSLRRMLFAKFEGIIPVEKMHIPEITCGEADNLPMLDERGEPLPGDLLLLADHSPLGLYDERVLARGRPFRIVLLREPLDRLQSFYYFCLRAGFLPSGLSSHAGPSGMPDETWRNVCRFFVQTSGIVRWLSPHARDVQSAITALLGCDVVGRHDDLGNFCERFGSRNPYGVRFDPEDILHVNATDRSSELSDSQRVIACQELEDDITFWNTPAIQAALEA